MPTSQTILAAYGIKPSRKVFWNSSAPFLYEEAVKRGEGKIAQGGGLVVTTGKHTGRSPNDKFIVREPSREKQIWWGEVNRPFEEHRFTALFSRVAKHLGERDLFIQDCFTGQEERFCYPVRFIGETAWHSLFAKTMFVARENGGKVASQRPLYTIIHAPSFEAYSSRDGTRSPVFILFHLAKRILLIGGTRYAGEIKKSMFTMMNYALPLEGVLSLHSAANIGKRGDVALFFGLSGTGKTALSLDKERSLIGDDELGWDDEGVFNLEAGCYAKTICLSPQAEPQIYAATKQFGTILENVVMDEATRELNFESEGLTENTRAAYSLNAIPNAFEGDIAPHPLHIIMLTCDAFGVMPPVAKFSHEQAVEYFLAGYTAKVAGTEKGISEPEATFSPCFGAPFIPLPPSRYGKLLKEKIVRHNVQCWWVNTGWVGGPYGIGKRIDIASSRAIIKAILGNKIEKASLKKDPIFGFERVSRCPEVPVRLLNPRASWNNKDVYDAKAKELATLIKQTASSFATVGL